MTAARFITDLTASATAAGLEVELRHEASLDTQQPSALVCSDCGQSADADVEAARQIMVRGRRGLRS